MCPHRLAAVYPHQVFVGVPAQRLQGLQCAGAGLSPWENHGKTMGKWRFNGGLMGVYGIYPLVN